MLTKIKSFLSLIRFFIIGLISRIPWLCKSVQFSRKYYNCPLDTITTKIEDWQMRERAALGICKPQSGKILTVLLGPIRDRVLEEVRNKPDSITYGLKDYWATSKEVLLRNQGDCEDFAVVALRRLRENGFADKDIGVVLISGHALVGIHHEHNDFLIIDNGFFTHTAGIKASELFPVVKDGKKLMPYAGFNLFEKWSY